VGETCVIRMRRVCGVISGKGRVETLSSLWSFWIHFVSMVDMEQRGVAVLTFTNAGMWTARCVDGNAISKVL
jgi:hypothetical protein